MKALLKRIAEDLAALAIGLIISLVFAKLWMREARTDAKTFLLVVGGFYVWITLVVYGDLLPIFTMPASWHKYRIRPIAATLLVCATILAVGLVFRSK